MNHCKLCGNLIAEGILDQEFCNLFHKQLWEKNLRIPIPKQPPISLGCNHSPSSNTTFSWSGNNSAFKRFIPPSSSFLSNTHLHHGSLVSPFHHQEIVEMQQKIESETINCEVIIDRTITEHLEALINDTSESFSDISRTIASIRSGGAFTSKKEDNGGLDKNLTINDLQTLQENVQIFWKVATRHSELRNLTANELADRHRLPHEVRKFELQLYRRVKSSHLANLKIGDVHDEILPISTSLSIEMTEDWSPNEGVIFVITVSLSYPMLFLSHRTQSLHESLSKRKSWMNLDQHEVTLAPSRFLVKTIISLVGETYVHVNSKPINEEETLTLIQHAKIRKEEEIAKGPKSLNLDIDQLTSKFSDDTAKDLINRKQVAVDKEFIDLEGKRWVLRNYDERFGLDFESLN